MLPHIKPYLGKAVDWKLFDTQATLGRICCNPKIRLLPDLERTPGKDANPLPSSNLQNLPFRFSAQQAVPWTDSSYNPRNNNFGEEKLTAVAAPSTWPSPPSWRDSQRAEVASLSCCCLPHTAPALREVSNAQWEMKQEIRLVRY